MLQSYVKPMLTHQFVERFGVRSALQEHLLKHQPIVPPEVLLKSDATLEKHNVLDDIFKEIVPEGKLSLPDTDPDTVEVSSIEFEKPAIEFEFDWGRLRSLNSPVTGVDMEFKAEFAEKSMDQGTDYHDLGGDADMLVASADVGGGFEGG